MSNKPVLVLGATGKTGSRIVSQLMQRGIAVRRGSRIAEKPFDWENPATWDAALKGVRAVYISYFPDIAFPGAVEKIKVLTELARSNGVSRVVLLTGRGEFHAQRAEDVVKTSGVPYTIVRAAWFAQNFSEGALHAPVMDGVVPMPGGNVREPIVDVDDIADVAVAALTEDGHDGQLYEVTGPRLMTFGEMAEVLSSAAGRPVQHISISFEDFRAEVARANDAMVADIITDIARETLDGRNAHLADGVERALGRAPRDFVEFAEKAARNGAWQTTA